MGSICELAKECHGPCSWCDTCGNVDQICKRGDCSYHWLICASCGHMETEPFAAGDECTHCGGPFVERHTVARPAYSIPAREVVPGMLFCGPIAGFSLRADSIVEVQPPGPSPRELACTCKPGMGRGPGSAREAMSAAFDKSPGPETVAADMLRPWRCAPPGEHLAACPVAPVTGRHGGMRLWPATWRGCIWTCNEFDVFRCDDLPRGNNAFSIDYIDMVGTGERSHISRERDWHDVILQCFYLPQVPQQPDRRQEPAWDPYGTDLDLAVRYG